MPNMFSATANCPSVLPGQLCNPAVPDPCTLGSNLQHCSTRVRWQQAIGTVAARLWVAGLTPAQCAARITDAASCCKLQVAVYRLMQVLLLAGLRCFVGAVRSMFRDSDMLTSGHQTRRHNPACRQHHKDRHAWQLLGSRVLHSRLFLARRVHSVQRRCTSLCRFSLCLLPFGTTLDAVISTAHVGYCKHSMRWRQQQQQQRGINAGPMSCW